jgi:DNA-binding IclR family transcriptional regulator
VKHSPHETRTGFGAGDAMPILSGANAMLIQAFLSRHLQKKLYSEKQAELAIAGRGKNFEEFKQGLQAIRQARVCVVTGVVRSDSTGIAAPLLGPKNQILGTFSFSVLTKDMTPGIEEALKLRVHEVGIRVSEILQRDA